MPARGKAIPEAEAKYLQKAEAEGAVGMNGNCNCGISNKMMAERAGK